MRIWILRVTPQRREGTVVFRRALVLAVFLFGLIPTFIGLAAQQNAPENPSDRNQGWFLIARRELSNLIFSKSTVLVTMMVPGEPEPGVVGLIVNKPTKMKLEELFPHARSVKKQNVTAYFGGPVDIHDVSALFRGPTTVRHAQYIFGDVYVTFDPKSVEELVKKSRQPSELRVFLGRWQWSEPQLRHEIAIGAWYSTHQDAGPIFASDPRKVWETLVDRIAPRRPYVDYRRRACSAGVVSRSTL
ncbi:MAG TPA: YqgE/AlgH family protein [Candidatus Acidoferrum sp.]|nr:YqgE/AlgH family protein [Candidatus Acidoferrum sp.]